MALSRDVMLRYVVAIHFLGTCMVMMTDWLPFGYSLAQFAIIVLGLWAITSHDSAVQVELLMVITFFSLFIDSIAIGMYFRLGRQAFTVLKYSSYFNMSAFFAIALLLSKPIMLMSLNKVRQDRLGDRAPPAFGGWTSNTTPTSVPGYIPVSGDQTV